jgi:excisionase family DNA binding protein
VWVFHDLLGRWWLYVKTALQDEAPARPRLYTVDEAAAELRISRSHLYGLIEQGRVGGVVRLGRVLRVDLDALLASQVTA